jgi:hypothetical protein
VEIEVSGCGGCEEGWEWRGLWTVVGGLIKGECSGGEVCTALYLDVCWKNCPKIDRCPVIFRNRDRTSQ